MGQKPYVALPFKYHVMQKLYVMGQKSSKLTQSLEVGDPLQPPKSYDNAQTIAPVVVTRPSSRWEEAAKVMRALRPRTPKPIKGFIQKIGSWRQESNVASSTSPTTSLMLISESQALDNPPETVNKQRTSFEIDADGKKIEYHPDDENEFSVRKLENLSISGDQDTVITASRSAEAELPPLKDWKTSGEILGEPKNQDRWRWEGTAKRRRGMTFEEHQAYRIITKGRPYLSRMQVNPKTILDHGTESRNPYQSPDIDEGGSAGVPNPNSLSGSRNETMPDETSAVKSAQTKHVRFDFPDAKHPENTKEKGVAPRSWPGMNRGVSYEQYLVKKRTREIAESKLETIAEQPGMSHDINRDSKNKLLALYNSDELAAVTWNPTSSNENIQMLNVNSNKATKLAAIKSDAADASVLSESTWDKNNDDDIIRAAVTKRDQKTGALVANLWTLRGAMQNPHISDITIGLVAKHGAADEFVREEAMRRQNSSLGNIRPQQSEQLSRGKSLPRRSLDITGIELPRDSARPGHSGNTNLCKSQSR